MFKTTIIRTSSLVKMLLISIAAVAVVGCATDPHVAEQISHAEAIAMEKPDSALKILRPITNSSISPRSVRAKHALLLSYACDQCYIDIDSDSLIRVAVDYYQDRDDVRSSMLTHYLKGRVGMNARSYSSAVVDLMTAEGYAKECGDYFYLGKIYRAISDIFGIVYDNSNAIKYGYLAHEFFEKSGNELYSDWALSDLGRLYHNAHDYKKSIEIQERVLDKARLSGNTDLYVTSSNFLATSYIAVGSFARSIECYQRVLEIAPNTLKENDYELLGIAYVKNGNIERARECLAKLGGMSKGGTLSYHISLSLNDYVSATRALEYAFRRQNDTLKSLVTQDVSREALEFSTSKNKLNEQRLQLASMSIAIVVIIFVFIVLLAIVVIRNKLNMKKREIEENMMHIASLRDLLMLKDDELVYRQNSINELFSSHFATFDQLSSLYYECQGTSSEKIKIYNEVVSLIRRVSADKKTIKSMEHFIDSYNDNLMSKFHQAYPDINNLDANLFMFIVLGFSSRAISIFMNEKLDVVYNRKSRLKSKIQKSDVANKEDFLIYFK